MKRPGLKKTGALLGCGALLFNLCGCGVASSSQPVPPPAATSRSVARPAAVASQPEEALGTVKVVLPSNQPLLAEVLREAARQDSLDVEIETLPADDAYAKGLRAALEEEAAADIMWVGSEYEARLLGGATALANLQGEQATPAFWSLAEMVPKASRLLNASNVYGLPMGFYAEGYLVNLEILGHLLDTTDYTALRNDLQQCSWKQWEYLVNSITQYMQKQAKIQIKLGNSIYYTPGIRPVISQPLRGIFAFANEDPAFMIQGALSGAVNATFDGLDSLLAADDSQKQEMLRPALESLWRLLEFETRNLARREGATQRGESFAEKDGLSRDEAAELFINGTALFLRGDSRLAFQLGADNPAIGVHLAMVPVKFPPGKDAEEEKKAEDGAEAEAAAEGEVTTTAERLVKHNSLLWVGSAGYLCLNPKAQHPEGAQLLLLGLFVRDDNQSALQAQLNLLPFTNLVPVGLLSSQLALGADGEGSSRILLPSHLLSRTEVATGGLLQGGLLAKAEWTDEDEATFISTALLSLSFPSALGEAEAPA